MEIKWFGHSAFQIITQEGLKILIDPFISNNPACKTPVEEIEADIICITHGHSDHFGDAMEIADRTGAELIGNHEISLFLSRQGLEATGLNIGGSYQFHDIKITMLQAFHSSTVDFTSELIPTGSAVSYLIELENGEKIFHAGDTGLFSDMKLIIGDIFQPDIAMIPIGDRFTMGPKDAALAAKWINAKTIFPMHYNTFPPIEQDTQKFTKLVKNLNEEIEVIILEPGESYIK